MAQIGKNLDSRHTWTPPWWGNEKLSKAEQFFLVLRPVTMGESRAFQSGLSASADSAKAMIDVVAERIVSIRNLRADDGTAIEDPKALLDMITAQQFTELSTVIFRGLSESEGNV